MSIKKDFIECSLPWLGIELKNFTLSHWAWNKGYYIYR